MVDRTPDLHTHSNASDGTLSPAALVARAAESGVRMLALTDHDTTAGLADAAAAAAGLGVLLVPGVEISVTWDRRTLHIVGLGVDSDCRVLQGGLLQQRAFRNWQAKEIGTRLARTGIAGAHAGALALSSGDSVGPIHFARFLTGRELASTEREAVKRYLVRGTPGYVPGDWARLETAMEWIRAAGGQAVIAHPGRYALAPEYLRALLGEFRELGGVAIEVVSGNHSLEDTIFFARASALYAFWASAGSDFHGPGLAPPEELSAELGRLPALPLGCTPIWASALLPIPKEHGAMPEESA
jgi:predicted metal-dependent phosphoesterase TrpH